MKGIFLVLNLFCISSMCWAIDKASIEKMSFNKLQLLQSAYIKFVLRVEKTQQYGKYKEESFSYFDPLRNYLNQVEFIQTAYGANGDLCFFGGWPSKQLNNVCKRPWIYQNDSEMKKYGATYSSEMSCGTSSKFRCNPTLFGTPDGGDGKGYCVETEGTFVELTQKCEIKSRNSIATLASKLKEQTADGEKARESLVNFQKAIFGSDGKISEQGTDSGFCDTFRTKTGELYDACDDLQKRIQDLGKEIAQQDQLSGEVISNSDNLANENLPPQQKQNVAVAKIFQSCQNYLAENSSDDIYNRNIIGYLQGGLSTCSYANQQGELETLNEDEIEKIFDYEKKKSYLKELNFRYLKRNLEALLVTELSFMSPDGKFPEEKLPLESKEAFRKKILSQFDFYFDKADNKDEITKLIDDVYEGVMQYKDKLPKMTYENNIKIFNELANNQNDSVNKFCQDIYNEYHEKFKDRIRSTYTEWLRPFSDEEKLFLNEKRRVLKAKINRVYAKSNMGFLLGTDVFADEVMDPSIDYAKECAKEPVHSVINPNMYKVQYQRALTEAREKLLDSFKDFGKDKMLKKNESSNYHVAGVIKDYLKSDRELILDSFVNNDNEEEQKNLAKYICGSVQDIYDKDEYLQGFGIIGGGLAALAGGVLAIGGGVLCPATGIGCAVAVAGTNLSYAGTGVLAVSAGMKGVEAFTEEDRNQKVQLGNMTGEASLYMEKSQAVHHRKKDAAIDGATIAGGFVLGAGIKAIRARSIKNAGESFENISKISDDTIHVTINPKSSPALPPSPGKEVGEVIDGTYVTIRPASDPNLALSAPKAAPSENTIYSVSSSGEVVPLKSSASSTQEMVNFPVPYKGSSSTELIPQIANEAKQIVKSEGELIRATSGEVGFVTGQTKELSAVGPSVKELAVIPKIERTRVKTTYSILTKEVKKTIHKSPVGLPLHEAEKTRRRINEKSKINIKNISGISYLPTDLFSSYDNKEQIERRLEDFLETNRLDNEEIIKSLQSELKILENLRNNNVIDQEQLELEIVLGNDIISKLSEK